MPKLKSNVKLSHYFNTCVPVKLNFDTIKLIDQVICSPDALGIFYKGRSSYIRSAIIKQLDYDINKLNKR